MSILYIGKFDCRSDNEPCFGNFSGTLNPKPPELGSQTFPLRDYYKVQLLGVGLPRSSRFVIYMST